MPRTLHRGLASSVHELDAGRRPLAADEVCDAGELRHVAIVPDPQVAVGQPCFGRHRQRLGEHQARSAQREAPEVHEVELVRLAVGARRVLLHGRDDDAVAQLHATERERRQEGRGRRVSHRMVFARPLRSTPLLSWRPVARRREAGFRQTGHALETPPGNDGVAHVGTRRAARRVRDRRSAAWIANATAHAADSVLFAVDGGRIPHRRAQPSPASVPAAGRYSQPTHPVYPKASMRGSSHS